MTKPHLKLVTPATVKRTVTPKRLPNDKLRTREYLTEGEVERLTGNGQRKPPWPPRRDHDPCRLPARSARVRTD